MKNISFDRSKQGPHTIDDITNKDVIKNNLAKFYRKRFKLAVCKLSQVMQLQDLDIHLLRIILSFNVDF